MAFICRPKMLTSWICLLVVVPLFQTPPSILAQQQNISASNPMILRDSMPLAWRYLHTTINKDGIANVDTVQTLFLKRVDAFQIPNPRFGPKLGGYPESMVAEGNTALAWLVLNYAGYQEYWFETDAGLFRSSYRPPRGLQERGGVFYLLLPSQESDIDRWTISADASKWSKGSYDGTFQDKPCRIMITEWIHTPPNQGETHYWGLGVGLIRVESRHSDVERIRNNEGKSVYMFPSLQTIDMYELIDFMPRDSIDNITHLKLRFNADDLAFTQLKEFTSVKSIDLSGSRVRDEDISLLKYYSNLEVLDLRNTRLTSGAVQYLSNLNKLSVLFLPEQLSKPEIIEELLVALPNTQINP